MERHRCWLWAVGTAVGLQMTMMPSSIAHITFLRQSPWIDTLDAAISNTFLNEAILDQVSTASQRQTNTVTIDRIDLSKPHFLTLKTDAEVSGAVMVNGARVTELTAATTRLDLAPYLTERGTTEIAVIGHYFPHNATVQLQFEGPDIAINQQSSGVGELNYRLNLEVD
jgi:hypothetical protein